jgi:MFS family permease
MNPFQGASKNKKLLTVMGIYIGMIGTVATGTTFSGVLPVAALEFADGDMWPLAISISGILGLCAMPLFGYFGAKNPALKRILVSVSLLIGALVLLGRALAFSMTFLILISIFVGFASASLFVLGFTMIRDMFTQQQSGIYLGMIATMMSIGLLGGPFLVGIALDTIGWRALNVILCVILLIAAGCVWFGVKVSKEEAKPLAVPSVKFDVVGAICVTAFLACLIIVLSMTSQFPLGSPVSNILFAVAALSLIALVFDIRKKQGAAIIPLTVFKDRNSVIFALMNFVGIFSVMSFLAFLPAFVRATMTTDPIVTTIGMGLASLLPTSLLAVAGLFLGPIFGKMIAKSGNARSVVVFGTAVRLLVFGSLFVLFLGVLGSMPYWAILVLSFVGGIYTAQNNVTFSTGPQIQIKPELRVQSNSIIQMGQNLGSGVAVPVYTLILTTSTVPLIAQGLEPGIASVMAMGTAMPIMFGIATGVIVVLFLLAFMLKPLPKPEEAPGGKSGE